MPRHAAQLREALPPHWAHEADRHAEFAHCAQHHPTARNKVGWRENAGVRTSSGQSILYGALAKRQALSTSSTGEQRL
jgi:hypothetical protein